MLEGSKVSAGLHAYYNEYLQDKSWNLGDLMKVFDTELFAIEQALHLTNT